MKLKSLIKKNKIKVLRNKFKSNVGRAWVEEKSIRVPVIKDIESIYIILHEIGHIVLNHISASKKPLYLEEMEAELFALSYLKKWDIHKLFNEDYENIKIRAQRYIRWSIMYTIQRSLYNSTKILQLKNIHLIALKFSRINKFQKQEVSVVKKRKKI